MRATTLAPTPVKRTSELLMAKWTIKKIMEKIWESRQINNALEKAKWKNDE